MATVDKLVVDASVLVAWFIPETPQEGAIARATIARFAEGLVELYAPAIMPVEVAAALVKATRRDGRKYTQKMAREALDQAEKIAFVVEGYPGTAREMMENAFRWQCGAYDGLYIDLAQRLGCPVATVDRGCVKVASTLRWGCLLMTDVTKRARLIGDIEAAHCTVARHPCRAIGETLRGQHLM